MNIFIVEQMLLMFFVINLYNELRDEIKKEC